MLNILEKPVIAIKICRKILVISQLSAIILEKVQRYQDLKKYLQYISNRYVTKKLNVVNEVLATKKASEYQPKKKYSYPRKQLEVEVREI